MDLPSTIACSSEPDCWPRLQSILSSLEDVRFSREGDQALISVPAASKMPILQLLAMQKGITDITIREPSLEDVFFGYGGKHAQAA